MAKLRTLSILLSLLVPVHSTRSPDCGGILTPLGLSYCKSGPLSAGRGGSSIFQSNDETSDTVTTNFCH